MPDPPKGPPSSNAAIDGGLRPAPPAPGGNGRPPASRAPRPFRCPGCAFGRLGVLEIDGHWRVLHVVEGSVDVTLRQGRVRCPHCRRRVWFAAERVAVVVRTAEHAA